MSNDFTKNYQDGTGLTEAQLDTAFQTVKPSRANLALSTAGSTTKTLLQSQGNNLTPEWVSLNTAINDTTITEAAANKIVLASDLYCNDVGVYNIGMSYSSPTLTIHSADGSALSASNPAIAVMPSALSSSYGQTVILEITSNFSFQDDTGTNELDADFGTKPTSAWTEPRPFYIYVVNTDDTSSGCVLALCPIPHLKSISFGYGWKGNSTGLTDDRSVFFLTSSDPLPGGTSPSVRRIGVFCATKVLGGEWTVDVSNNNPFGIGLTKGIGYSFQFAAGECLGSGSGTFFTGSNNPTWATPAGIIAYYAFDQDGNITLEFNTQVAGNCTNGSTSTPLQLALPYEDGISSPGKNASYYAGAIRSEGLNARSFFLLVEDGAVTNMRLNDGTPNDVQKDEFTSSGDDFILNVTYPANGSI